MADIIPIAAHLPDVDPDLIESLRTMLSEAQAGRLTQLAAVYVTDEGGAQSVYHFADALLLVGATSLLHQDALGILSE